MNFRPDPKIKTFRSKKMLALARDMACAECGIEDKTVVAAHSNMSKGMAIKSSDASVIYLCGKHHDALDHGAMTKDQRREYEERLNYKTLRMLVERGYLVMR